MPLAAEARCASVRVCVVTKSTTLFRRQAESFRQSFRSTFSLFRDLLIVSDLCGLTSMVIRAFESHLAALPEKQIGGHSNLGGCDGHFFVAEKLPSLTGLTSDRQLTVVQTH